MCSKSFLSDGLTPKLGERLAARLAIRDRAGGASWSAPRVRTRAALQPVDDVLCLADANHRKIVRRDLADRSKDIAEHRVARLARVQDVDDRDQCQRAVVRVSLGARLDEQRGKRRLARSRGSRSPICASAT